MEEEAIQGIRRIRKPVDTRGAVSKISPKARTSDSMEPGGERRMLDIIGAVCPECLRGERQVKMKRRKLGKHNLDECPECGAVLLNGDKLEIGSYERGSDESFIIYDRHGNPQPMETD